MPSTPTWIGSIALVEDPSSPEWVYGEHITVTRTFTGPHATALAAAPLKGAFGTGDAVGLRVSESRVRRSRGGIGQLVIVYETVGQPAAGAALPPSEINLEPQKIERSLKKHPRYVSLTLALKRKIDIWLESLEDDTSEKVKTAKAAVEGNALALELYKKLLDDFTHYALYPPAVKITSYHWTPQTASAGGFRQSPPIQPVDVPTGIDWLREGDGLTFNGTHWVLVRAWIGAPNLDTDIYPTS